MIEARRYLPTPEDGVYRYPDGSAIAPAHSGRGFLACWADGTPLMHPDEEECREVRSRFDSPMAAAAALAEGGEGPAVRDKEERLVTLTLTEQEASGLGAAVQESLADLSDSHATAMERVLHRLSRAISEAYPDPWAKD